MTATLTRPAPPARRRRPQPLRPLQRAVMPLPVALLAAAAAGIAYSFAFPVPNVWILAFPAVGVFLATLRGRGFRTGLLVGFVFGLAFWFCLVDWVTLFLGPLPLVAAGTLEALFVALGGGLIAIADRSIALLRPGAVGRIVVAPLVIAAIWTMREVFSGTWPYGGFAWGRFSLSQSTSPFAPLAAWFGLSGLSFVLVWLTALAVALALEPTARFGRVVRPARHDVEAAALPRLLAVAVVAGLLLWIPAFPITVSGSMRIAAVQPNSHAGYFDPDYDPAANLRQTVEATAPAVGRQVDLVVWPEGAAMYDPFHDRGLQNQLTVVSEIVGAPLLTGAITQRGAASYNTSVLWTAGGGLTAWYDKVHPVPFGEYVPDRAFWTPFAPDLLKLIGRDYSIGQRSSVLEVGSTKVGVNICFDIVDDGLILGSVADGAQILVAQTNNADFGDTDENEQQLAIARLRAIETGRSMMSDSTVASTTAIGPDGRTFAKATPFRTQTLVTDLPLATGITPAVAFGVPLGASIAILGGVLPLLLAGLARPLRRRRRGA